MIAELPNSVRIRQYAPLLK